MKDQALTIRARRLSEPAFEFNHRFTDRTTVTGSGMCSDAVTITGDRYRQSAIRFQTGGHELGQLAAAASWRAA